MQGTFKGALKVYGYLKGQALGKLTGREDDFARLI